MGLPPAATCNSVSCGSGCCCASVFPFNISQGRIPLAAEFDLVGMFAQGPSSQIMSFSRSPAIAGSFFAAGNSLGNGLAGILFPCPFVSVLWDKNFECTHHRSMDQS